MKIFSKSITGKERGILAPEHEVLVEFYKAFNTQNIELMEKNWSASNGIMNNPLGGILRDWENIQEVHKKIFFGGAEVYSVPICQDQIKILFYSNHYATPKKRSIVMLSILLPLASIEMEMLLFF